MFIFMNIRIYMVKSCNISRGIHLLSITSTEFNIDNYNKGPYEQIWGARVNVPELKTSFVTIIKT
jgi:hypothetical protein